MSAHSHYLFSTAPAWGKLSSMELMGAALNILFPLCLPLLSTSTFQQLPVWHLSSILAPQAQWDIRRLFFFFFFREEEGNPAALSWASSTMAGPLGPYLLAWLGRTE